MNPTISFRPPSVPLIVHDPYLSIWSSADELAGTSPVHWTGQRMEMQGLLRVDGVPYLFCGPVVAPEVQKLKQLSLDVTPTQTCYTFEGGGIGLTLTFLTAALPHDLDRLGRPLTHLLFEVESRDHQAHEVELYWDVSAEVAVDQPFDEVVWGRLRQGDLELLRVAHAQQKPLNRSGDHHRIDWGSAFLSFPHHGAQSYLGRGRLAREAFIHGGALPTRDDTRFPCRIKGHEPVMAVALPLGKVGDSAVQRRLAVSYDDGFGIELFHQKLRSWWSRDGLSIGALIEEAESDFETTRAMCLAFDQRVMAECEAVGGEAYAKVAALAFRQSLGAHKLVASPEGRPLYFSKENFSGGYIGTVDVTYPSAPFFLHYNPDLLAAMLDPVLSYAESGRWKFPFAPHDLGTYPLANGQAYGGGEEGAWRQMPVEECANLVLLVAALALRERDRLPYAKRWWGLLKGWTDYLAEHGLDPVDQLCTDDFTGTLARNANLSIKAIMAIGAFAKVAELLGESATGERFSALAREMTGQWLALAGEDDATVLAFGQPGTWSQKYNLVWDRLLGLNLFPVEVVRREVDFYHTQLQPHGLPLDSRHAYTKLDWVFWSASLTGERGDLLALIEPSLRWISTGVHRVPMGDFYRTTGGGETISFRARSVVGGIFVPLL